MYSQKVMSITEVVECILSKDGFTSKKYIFGSSTVNAVFHFIQKMPLGSSIHICKRQKTFFDVQKEIKFDRDLPLVERLFPCWYSISPYCFDWDVI